MTDQPKKRRSSSARAPIRRPEPAGENADSTSPEQWVAEQERSFEETGNPIYVWQALDSLIFRRFNAALESEDWKPGDPLPQLVLPEWCTRYLRNAALRIEYLSRGLDVSQQPPPNDQSRDTWYATPTLSAKKALSHLPASLGFTKAGWNAFDEFWRTERKRKATEFRDRLRSDGLSPREVNEKVMMQFNLQDDRTIRRYAEVDRRHRASKPKLP